MAITGCLRQIKTFIKVGEQFDAPNMLLLPSAACLPGPLAPLRVHVRAQCDFFYLVTENRNTAHYFAEMISWRLGLGSREAVSWGCWCCLLPLFRSVVPSTYQLLVHFSLQVPALFLDAEIQQQFTDLQPPRRSG